MSQFLCLVFILLTKHHWYVCTYVCSYALWLSSEVTIDICIRIARSWDPLLSFPKDMENDEEALAQCLQAIAQLPTANKDTLAFIILHIKT